MPDTVPVIMAIQAIRTDPSKWKQYAPTLVGQPETPLIQVDVPVEHFNIDVNAVTGERTAGHMKLSGMAYITEQVADVIERVDLARQSRTAERISQL